MTHHRLTFSLFAAIIMSIPSLAQTTKPAVDYLQLPGPIMFENKPYGLSWTSHPAPDFYKQEYLVKGDDPNKFHAMILVDVVTGQSAVKTVLAAKVAELKKMKAGNPMINFEVIENPKTGEYILDFLLTANAADGTIAVAERNVYRYKAFKNKGGQAGVLLFGVSNRVYGADVTSFFTSLKAGRKDLVTKVAQVAMPDITIRN